MRTQRDAIATLPPGLLDQLRAVANDPFVRPDELARVRRLMETLSIDCPVVIEGIATGILETADVASV